MSELVFSSDLSGYQWDSKKKPVFSTLSHSPMTGRDVRIALYRQPVYEFILHNGWMNTADKNSLMAFFVARKGVLDSFLYADEDCDVSNQVIGAGNGVITTFQLIKNTGAAVEWVCNPAPNAQIYVAGALKTAITDYGINWKGEVVFVVAPAVGAVISWSGVAYYRCVFLADELEVSQFANLLYECGEIAFKGSFGWLGKAPPALPAPPSLARFYVDSPVKATETPRYVYLSSYALGGKVTIVNKSTLQTHEYLISPQINGYGVAKMGAADGDNCWFIVSSGLQYQSWLVKISPAGATLATISLAFESHGVTRVGDYLLVGTGAAGGYYGKVGKYDLSGAFIAMQTGDNGHHYDVWGEIVGVGTGYWAYVAVDTSIIKMDANLVQTGIITMPEGVAGIVGRIGDNIYLNGGGGFYRVNVITDAITFFGVPAVAGMATRFRAAGIDGSLLIFSTSYMQYTDGLWFFDTATEAFTREAVMVDDSINQFAVGYGWKRNGVYYALDVSGNYVIPYL